MSCVRIKRWVLRQGTGDLPEHWRVHIAGCAKCRALIEQISALDSTLEQGDVPDPGEAYWEGFAPSVARRLEALHDTKERHEVPASSRWSWARAWAPAVGVAVLALLIGRELTREYAPPTVTDSEMTAPTVGRLTEAPSMNATEPEPVVEQPATVANHDQRQQAKETPDRSSRGTMTEQETGPTMRAQEPVTDEGAITTDDGSAANLKAETEMATLPPPDQITDSDDESSVWPDRRVQIMGQVDRAGDDQPTMDVGGLSEQERAAGTDQRFAWIGGESSGTPSPVARLEAPRTFRSADLPDSQSPTEAMRRFDELSELQTQIDGLEKIDAKDRSEQETFDLCAMWYRVGTITSNPSDLDQAIERLDTYTQTMKDNQRREWQQKRELLIQRRATLIR